MWLLGERAHHETADESRDFAVLPVLGLQLEGQLVSFDKRRVLELELSLGPLLPCLSWIDHWILIDVLVLPEEVGHVLHVDHLLQVIQKHGVIDVPVVVHLCQFFILFGRAQFFFGALVDERCYFVVARQHGEFQCGQSVRGHELVVCTVFQQVSDHSDVIPLDSSNERRLSILCRLIDGSLALLNQEGSGGVISIVGSPVQWGHLGLLGDFVVEQVWSFLQQFADVLGVLAVNVVEEVLAVGVGHCQTLGCSHGQLITNTLQSNVYGPGQMWLVEVCVIFGLVLCLFLGEEAFVLRGFDLHPFLYLLHSRQCVQFLIALFRVNHPFDLLHPSQDFEEEVIEFFIGGVFFAVVDDVLQHAVVGVVFLEIAEDSHEFLLAVTAFGVPFVVQGENKTLQVLETLLCLAEFVDLDLGELLVQLDVLQIAQQLIFPSFQLVDLSLQLSTIDLKCPLLLLHGTLVLIFHSIELFQTLLHRKFQFPLHLFHRHPSKRLLEAFFPSLAGIAGMGVDGGPFAFLPALALLLQFSYIVLHGVFPGLQSFDLQCLGEDEFFQRGFFLLQMREFHFSLLNDLICTLIDLPLDPFPHVVQLLRLQVLLVMQEFIKTVFLDVVYPGQVEGYMHERRMKMGSAVFFWLLGRNLASDLLNLASSWLIFCSMTMELIRSFCNCAPCLPSSLFSALQMSFFMRSQQQRSSTSCSLTSSSSLVKEESRPSRCLRVPSCSCCFLLRNCWLQMESASTLALLVQWCILPMLLSSSAEEQINTDHSIRQRVDYIQREEMARRGKSSHQRCCGMEEGMGGWRVWVGRCLYLNMFYLIVAVQLVLALLYVAYLIHQYSMPQVSAVVKILVYLTWLLSFIIVVILPYDVYHSLQSDYTMSVVWKVIYYLIFILTWLLLPVAQEYETAGEFTPKEKFKTALINNLIIYGIFAVLGVAFVVYLSLKDKLNLEELTPVLMAASNAFGMFLVVIFLSHGLVAIPKQLWREKKYEIKLKQKQFAAVGLAHKKEKIIQELQLKVKELYWHIKKNGESVESNYIANLIPERYREKWRKNVPDLGEVHLVKLHREIKEQLLQLARLQRRWEELVEQTFLIEDILTNVSNPNRRIESTLFSSSRYEFVNYGKWLWYCRIKAYLTPIMAIFFSLFAAAVIIAQVAVFMPSLSFLNPFGRLVQMETFIGLDCSLMVVMSYVVFCVYYSLFKLKFANYYGLYWNRQTDASSLMFFAINCSRVSTPLCYNFLQIINNQRTAFSKVMGEANLVPVFGETFPIIFPILLIILIVVNIFDVYAMIAKMFGLQKFQFESGFQHENIDEGKRLLQKARIQIENRILNSNNKDLREYRSYRWETGLGSQQPTRKESSSSEQIALSGGYYNQFANMHNAGKILAL